METIDKADPCMEAHMAELKQAHPEMEHDQMVAIALKKCGESNKALVEKADTPPRTNPDDWADVPDPKLSSTWALYIGDAEHIAGAITAMQPGGYRGNKVQLGTARSKVIARIRAAINKRVSDKDQKANLLDRLARVKALEKAFSGMLMQDEVNYVELSASKGKACANCRWYMANMDCCHLVMAMPDPILATGYCDRWETEPQPEMPEPAPIPVTIVEPEMAMDDSGMMKALDNPSVVQKVWKAIQGYIHPAQNSELQVWKGGDGRYYWHASFTNNLLDREDQILSARAHADYINRVDMALVPPPTLRIWHIKGTDHGQADVLWYSGADDGSDAGAVHAIGHFDDGPLAEKAVAYYRKNPVKLSHGFVAPEWALHEGVFSAYNTFEISTLPPYAAANPYTSFEELTKEMALTETKRRHLKTIGLSDQQIADIEAVDTTVKEIADSGKAMFKDFGDFAATTPTEKPAASDHEKALSAVYFDLVKEQAEVFQLVKAQAQAYEALKAENAALKQVVSDQKTAFDQDIRALKTQVNLPVQRASEAASTQIPAERVETLKSTSPLKDVEARQAAKAIFGAAIKEQ